MTRLFSLFPNEDMLLLFIVVDVEDCWNIYYSSLQKNVNVSVSVVGLFPGLMNCWCFFVE